MKITSFFLIILFYSFQSFAACNSTFDCVSQNDEDGLEKVLKSGADANALNAGGGTALSAAASLARKPLCAMLIRFGANVNLKNRDGSFPLIESVTRDSEETTRFLLQAGATVNTTNSRKETALMIAAKNGYLDPVTTLITFSANVNLRDNEGNHALNIALFNSHDDVAFKLIDAGSNLSAKNKAQNFPLIYAAHYGMVRATRAMVGKNVAVDEKGQDGRTALYDASWNGHREVVNILIAARANPNILTDTGWSPLIAASSAGHTEVVYSLVGAKANIQVQTLAEKTSALLQAIQGSHELIVRFLLDEGAQVNIRDRYDVTPLIAAVETKIEPIFNFVLNKNPNVNSQGADSKTALHYAIAGNWEHAINRLAPLTDLTLESKDGLNALMFAADYEQLTTMETLLRAKANINLKNSLGDTALCYSASVPRVASVNFLLNKNADVNIKCQAGRTALSITVQNPANSDVLNLLLAKNPDLESRDNQQLTALLIAVHARNLEALEKLLQADANPNIIDSYGDFPLAIALNNDEESVVRILLRYRANPDFRDKYGNTLTHNIINSRDPKKLKYLDVLFLGGADINAINNNGATALTQAVRSRDVNIFQYIISKMPNLNLSETKGRTALTLAIDEEEFDFARQLLDAGANPDLKDDSGTAPLTIASQREKRYVVLLLDKGARLEFKTSWQPYSRNETLAWVIDGVGKEISPYRDNRQQTSYRIDYVSNPPIASVDAHLRIFNTQTSRLYETDLALNFDDVGKTWANVDSRDLYPATDYKVNKNLYDAQIDISIGRHHFTAVSDKLLHIFRSQVLLFLPGIFGSEIAVDINGMVTTVFPSITHPYRLSELACDAQGVPLKPALRLDLLKTVTNPTGDSLTDDVNVYNRILNRDDVMNPRGFLKLYAIPRSQLNKPIANKEIYRVPYFEVIAWPYDWRLRLELAVDTLLAPLDPNHNEAIYPPYYKPSSIRYIIETLRKYKDYGSFIDNKVSLVGHSTGGLIARGVVKRPLGPQLVDKAFFIDVPFWGAPKAYYVYMTGDMGILIIPNSEMREIAPNAPIVYYLSPTYRYPDATFLGDKDRSEFTVAAPYVTPILNKAVQLGHYPAALPPWNNTLDQAAHNYMQAIDGEPRIGWSNVFAFYSDSKKDDTAWKIYLTTSQIEKIGNKGDGTVPVKSQKADFPASQLIEILSHPEHVPAPNEDQVWQDIIQRL